MQRPTPNRRASSIDLFIPDRSTIQRYRIVLGIISLVLLYISLWLDGDLFLGLSVFEKGSVGSGRSQTGRCGRQA